MNIVLKELHLSLFKKHVDLLIEFGPTLTVIRGANYRGKSSLLEGLFFCLFGVRAISGSRDQVRTTGHKGKTECKLIFTEGNQTVRIIRTLSTAELSHQREDGSWEMQAAGHTAVNEEMIKRIGQNLERTLMLCYSRQGETSALVTLGETKLNQIVERVSGALYADKLLLACGERVSEFESVLESLGPEPEEPIEITQKLAEELETSLASLNEEKAVCLEMRQNLRAEKVKQEEAREQAKQRNAAVTKAKAKRETLTTEVATLRGVVQTLVEQFEDLKAPSDTAAMVQEGKEIRELLDTYENDAHLKRTYITKRDASAEWITENEPKYEAAEENLVLIQSASELLNIASGQQDALNLTIGGARSRIMEATKTMAASECPTCKRPFEDGEAHKAAALADREEQQAILTEAEAELKMVQNKIKTVTDQIEKYRRSLPPVGWREVLKSKHQAVLDLNQKLQDLHVPDKSVIDALVDKGAGLRAQVRQQGELKEAYETAQVKITTQKRKLANLVEELESIEILEEIPVDTIQETIDALTERITARQETLEDLSQTIVVKHNDLMMYKKQIEKELARSQKRIVAEHKKARFSGLAKWLRDNKTAFLTETWDQMMSIITDFAVQATNGAIEKVLRDDDGNFHYVEGEHTLPIISASGGQKSIIGTGLRLALASLLPAGLGFIVLDEPSSDLDETHAAQMAGALRAQERQVILVTHRESEEFSSDNLIILE